MNFTPRNAQLLLESDDAPLSIRQLAQQTFRMKEQAKMENAMRKQRDEKVYERSFRQDRKMQPINPIPVMTNDGMIQSGPTQSDSEEEDVETPILLQSTGVEKKSIDVALVLSVISVVLGISMVLVSTRR